MATSKRTASKKKTTKKTTAARPVRKKTTARKVGKKTTAAKTSPSKKKTTKKKVRRGGMLRSAEQKKADKIAVKAIDNVAKTVHRTILKRAKPELNTPIRSLSNVHYSEKQGYFEIGKAMKVRALTVNTVKTFAQSLRMMALAKELIETNDFATKRDAYYQSKNWREAKFNEQPESDTVMDDMEAMFSIDGVSREELRFVPNEHGGAVAGQLTVIDRDLETGRRIRIDCTQFGSGAYAVPSMVEHLEFKTKAKFILVIETHGMFQRLQSHAYWRKANCILISMGGVPSRACRRFIRRLSDDCNLPVYAFTDCDPYGISNIYRTLKVGSGNAAHINRFFCVPRAKFLGLMPKDIEDFDLSDATHRLTETDVKRAKDALKNDPFFIQHKDWTKALRSMIKMGVRAEQQALSKHGLNFVIDEYLPYKLKHTSKFLP